MDEEKSKKLTEITKSIIRIADGNMLEAVGYVELIKQATLMLMGGGRK